jgi:C4-dicarboxylate-specific signal transduction histidine kinase
MYIIFVKFISYQEKINQELEQRIKEEVQKQREQEQILIQQSKLASMGEMIANIAHQWRQPLNALSMVIQNLEFSYKIGELDDELMKKTQDKSKLLITKMSTTIDDFRNFFKPSKQKSNFHINDIVNNSLEIINSTLENSNIKVEKELKENIPEVFTLENELSQVVLILLSNAKDALISDNIKSPLIKIETYNKNSSVLISIKDNAKGIKKDILEKIFEPYFTTKKDTNGTGIGLYMAKTIIEHNMNGKLNVFTSSSGSEFLIEIKKSRS